MLDTVAIKASKASKVSPVSTRISFVYIVALLFSRRRNFVFNSYNDLYITNFIVLIKEDYFTLPSYIYIIRLNPRDYIGIRTLLYLVRT